ncbi:MAG TPA: peptidylprolyl isomerase [Prolixibacteraceae bacterium]|nr:peptidylprolyl isomerase [Prolixibacteraceae bacterium]
MLKRFLFVLFLSGVILQVNAQTYHAGISTNMGDMTFELYDDTPLHRDAFIELARKGHFENTLFYRVIENYIIQGGSKDSRNAPPGKFIGYGDPEKTVNDEIFDHHICKKGALCAPRQPDEVNIFKQSDISQFFVVQGTTFRPGQLDTMELAVNRPIKKRIYRNIYTPDKKKRLKKLKKEERWDEARELASAIKDEIDVRYELAEGKLIFTEAQREAYTTIGGAPQIENEYTVFGELISGMNVIDKIATLKTDENNRPYTDVIIHVTIKKVK